MSKVLFCTVFFFALTKVLKPNKWNCVFGWILIALTLYLKVKARAGLMFSLLSPPNFSAYFLFSNLFREPFLLKSNFSVKLKSSHTVLKRCHICNSYTHWMNVKLHWIWNITLKKTYFRPENTQLTYFDAYTCIISLILMH